MNSRGLGTFDGWDVQEWHLGTTQWPTAEHSRMPSLYSPQAGVSLLALLCTLNRMKGFQSSVEQTEQPSQ